MVETPLQPIVTPQAITGVMERSLTDTTHHHRQRGANFTHHLSLFGEPSITTMGTLSKGPLYYLCKGLLLEKQGVTETHVNMFLCFVTGLDTDTPTIMQGMLCDHGAHKTEREDRRMFMMRETEVPFLDLSIIMATTVIIQFLNRTWHYPVNFTHFEILE